VGLVGYPNAGKSTLLSKITSARPKIADYPFTTLSPNLGVCIHKNNSFDVADIHGLIEGAHLGRGLGDEFLRHIERTKILVHIVDVFGYENAGPYENFIKVNKELKSFSKELIKKPMIVALNKIDLPGSKKLVQAFKKKVKNKKYKIFEISALTGKGITELLNEIIYILSKIPPVILSERKESEIKQKEYIFEPEFKIEKVSTGIFSVIGKKIENIVSMTNFQQEEAVIYLQKKLKKLGVERELKRHGIKDGDIVRIAGYEFEYRND
ncbi:MAG: Obg family GTPase CgtA, partial [Endomicrobiia bacterium]